ncbi:MAG: hypothetical protein LBS39_00070 [Campylobacteraceae bacterium]|jgi:hypothetical protein|nr:hypothetical protein [Campylobacteraceae bacterium]
MADLIKSLFEIGECFMSEKAKAKNKITSSKNPRIYQFEISDISNIILSIKTEDIDKHVCFRKASAGKLFYPTIQFINKEDLKKQISKGFEVQCLNTNKEALDALKAFIEAYINNDDIIDTDGIDAKKGVSCFVSLIYRGETYYEIFPELFDEHCNNPEIIDGVFDGIDFPTQNSEEVGYDANLPFCSTNEIVNENLAKSVKKHLLYLSKSSASKVKLGFELAIKGMNFNFSVGKMKMSVLPSVLGDIETNDKNKLFKTLKNLRDDDNENSSNTNIISDKMEIFNDFIEELVKAAQLEQKSGLSVVNTILLFEQSNAKIAIFKMINDVSPSQILRITRAMSAENITTSWSNYQNSIKIYSGKDEDKIAFYLPNFLQEEFGIGKAHNANIFLLDDRKMGIYEFLNSAARLNFKSGFRTSFKDIQRLANFFYKIDKIPKEIILRKMEDFEMELKNIDDLQELVKVTPFINDSKDSATLKSAYWMGALHHFLTAREYGLSGKSILRRKRNILGILDYKKLTKLYNLLETTAMKIQKIDEKKGIGEKASYCKSNMIENYVLAKNNTSHIPSASSIQLAFAAGENDAKKLKSKNQNSEEED